jgi:hypothetical protein
MRESPRIIGRIVAVKALTDEEMEMIGGGSTSQTRSQSRTDSQSGSGSNPLDDCDA